MADRLGQRVSIPGTAWMPPEQGDSVGEVSKYYAPSRGYPQGRIEVLIYEDRGRYLFPLDKFPDTWFLPGTEIKSPRALKSPTKTPTTAKRTRVAARAAAEVQAVQAAAQPLTSPRRALSPRGKGRGRASGATVTSPTQPEPDADVSRALSPRRGRSASRGLLTSPRGSGRLRSPSPGYRRRSTRAAAEDQAPAAAPARGFQPEGTPSPAWHLSRSQNTRNAILMFAVALPALVYGYLIATKSDSRWGSAEGREVAYGPIKVLDPLWWGAVGTHRPVLAVNLVFFFNVDVLFWLLSLLQGSTWLIDPYWTIIPVMINAFYQFHPSATGSLRGAVATVLTGVWSARLTHSYFRREEWQFGAREDWRFSKMSGDLGRHWWWLSFFAAYLSQHAMLVGITLPLHAAHSSTVPWDPVWDPLAAFACILGICIAWLGDSQLRRFMLENERRREQGLDPIPILKTGIWNYSRHPNYFGEQLWWWGVSCFGIIVGQPLLVAGTAFNSLCMVAVTVMVERRMAARPERREAWEEYARTTSVWVPWFKTEEEDKEA